MAANADVQPGDLLTTSGVDGVYPPGLAVARVAKVDRRVDSAFARVSCTPVGLVAGSAHVMVLAPVTAQIPPRPEPEPASAVAPKKGAKP
jgi:rod shape-determining protein MreC